MWRLWTALAVFAVVIMDMRPTSPVLQTFRNPLYNRVTIDRSMTDPTPYHPEHDGSVDVDAFIDRWARAQAAELSNAQSFLKELCRILGVPEPDPATKDPELDGYVFERPVVFDDQATSAAGRIDLYKRGCFVLETKQGVDEQPSAASRPASQGHGRRGSPAWHRVMGRAKEQAGRYAQNLDKGGWKEPVPPLLLVCDVGYCIDLYSNFGHPQRYVPHPDQRSFRILVDDLRSVRVRETLRLAWLDPMQLDPSRRQAEVTRELASTLAQLATSLEKTGASADAVFGFLTRCLFTMFAEDTGLLPDRAFTRMLKSYEGQLDLLPAGLGAVWAAMNSGGYSPDLRTHVRQFNGGLFTDSWAPVLTREQLALLLQAAGADWTAVEPAIFGTLLERALDPRERHKLGAHFTPREFVERLVVPAVIEPLRQEWEAVQVAIASAEEEYEAAAFRTDSDRRAGERRTRGVVVEMLGAFRKRLASVVVLDPACGSGNFLYVTLEHMKRLEGEVRQFQERYSAAALEMESFAVIPSQFHGLEVNPRAAAIADLVLWIGFLQWHLRSFGGPQAIHDPVLHTYGNIHRRDAVLSYTDRRVRIGADGIELTIWDGRTTRTHPATGAEVPDPTARIPVYDYIGARQTEWPAADFIVGNPPYVGSQLMRDELGDGYTEALRAAYPELPDSADLVMFWWHKAAAAVRQGNTQRFGFITTNTITQTFNRRVVDNHLRAEPPLALVFVVPDHPWVDSRFGAAVRVAMTVGAKGPAMCQLGTVVRERRTAASDVPAIDMEFRQGTIFADLTMGVDITGVQPLQANLNLSYMGMKLVGDFVVTEEEATVLGLGTDPALDAVLPCYMNGRDMVGRPRGVRVIDLFGMEVDDVRTRFPAVYQRVLDRVKPERDQNKRAARRDRWWIFAEPVPRFRAARGGLDRYIITPEVSKHRIFAFVNGAVLPDGALISIASDSAYHLGVLSSRPHVVWTLAAGGTLEDRPRYTSTKTFQPFPFPIASPEQAHRIATAAEALDAHRKRVLAANADLTLTLLYNVLDEERTGRVLSARDRDIHERGQISILRELHDEIDAVVFEAYGWTAELTDVELLGHLVALNTVRASEEARGVVRFLRPGFQQPRAAAAPDADLGLSTATRGAPASPEKVDWPTSIVERVLVLRNLLAGAGSPQSAKQIQSRLRGARRQDVNSLLDTLVALGQATVTVDGRFAA